MFILIKPVLFLNNNVNWIKKKYLMGFEPLNVKKFAVEPKQSIRLVSMC